MVFERAQKTSRIFAVDQAGNEIKRLFLEAFYRCCECFTGCRIMAAIGAQASYGMDAKYLLVAPIWAIPKCLQKEGISLDDVDLFEINEAFSGSTAAVLKSSAWILPRLT